jgi:tetratricopeptide (TPR) repeat protein
LKSELMMFRLALILMLNACSGGVPPVPMGSFLDGDLPQVREFFDEQIREGDQQSAALFLNGLAQIEMLDGNLEKARRNFRQAGQVMGNWAVSSGEAFSAIVGSESSKIWRGDPHEKAMNAYYTGLLYWMLGEPDNARAAFKSGILADAESDEGEAQVDFALLYWLAGRMSTLMGLSSEAEQYFEEARQAREFAISHGARPNQTDSILADPAKGSLVCLVDIGIGPVKEVGGPQGHLAVVTPRPSEVESAEFFIDGESLGQSELLVDLNYQATTRGGKAMEGIRKGKAVLKTVTGVGGAILLSEGLDGHSSDRGEKTAIGLGLLAFSLFMRAEADVRTWETLPNSVHVLVADVPPGEHELELVFRGRLGNELPALSQTWTVEVPANGEGVYFFRSLPGLDRVEEVVQ